MAGDNGTTNKRQQLYDILKSGGQIKTMDYNTFESVLDNPEKNKRLYDILKSGGQIKTMDYDKFKSTFANTNPANTKAQSGYTTQSVEPKQPQWDIPQPMWGVEKEEKENREDAFGAHDLLKQPKPKPVETQQDVYDNYMAKFDASKEGYNMRQDMQRDMSDYTQQAFKAWAEGDVYKELTKRQPRNQKELDELNKKITEAFYADEDVKSLLELRNNEWNDRYSKALADKYGESMQSELGKAAKKEIGNSAPAKFEEEYKRIEDIKKANGWNTTSIFSSWADTMDDTGRAHKRTSAEESDLDQRNKLEAARQAISDAQELLRAATSNDGTWDSFVQGLYKNTKAGNYLFGANDLIMSKALYDTLNKYERGEKLTDAEDELLRATAINAAVTAYYSSDLNRAYKAGQTTAVSLPFMLEFLVNPASGVGKGIAKGLLMYVRKKMMRDIGRGFVGNAARVGARLVGDAAAAGIMTGTTSVPRVIGGAYDNQNANFKVEMDDGNLNVERVGNESFAKSLGRSAASNYFENQSEMVFNSIKGATKVLGRAASSVTAPKYVSNAINYVTNSNAAKFVSEAAHKVKSSGAAKFVSEAAHNKELHEWMRRTQFHGLPKEYLEEVYNNFAHVAMGEMSYEEAVNLDNNIDTFVGLAPTSIAFGVLGVGTYGAHRYKVRKGLSKLSINDPTTKEIYNQILQSVNDNDYERVKNKLEYDVILNSKLTPQQRKELIAATYLSLQAKAIDEIDATRTPEQQAADNEAERQAAEADVMVTDPNARRKAYRALLRAQSHGTTQDLVNAKQAWQPFNDEISARRDEYVQAQREQAEQDVKTLGNQDTGRVTRAVMTGAGEVQIVGGTLVADANGGIDVNQSSETIFYIDADGNRKMASPDKFASIKTDMTTDEFIKNAERTASNEFYAQEDAELGTPDIPTPAQLQARQQQGDPNAVFTAGDKTYAISEITNKGITLLPLNAQGQLDTKAKPRVLTTDEYYKIMEATYWGEAAPAPQAAAQTPTETQTPTEAEPQEWMVNDTVEATDDNGNVVSGILVQMSDDDVVIQTADKLTSISREQFDQTAHRPSETTAESNTETTTETQTAEKPKTALSQIPSEEVKEGKETKVVHKWTEASPDLTYDALSEIYHGDAERVANGIKTRLANIAKDIKAAQKKIKAIDNSDDFDAVAAQQDKYDALQEQIKQLEAQKAYWQSVLGVPAEREKEAKRRAEQEAQSVIDGATLNGIPDVVDDKPQDARSRGFRRVNGHKVDRQQPIQSVQGKEVEVKFADGVMPKGRVTIIDASQLQPSHTNGQRNALHFLDEAQPKERKDAASAQAAERMAKSIRPEEITSSVTAFTGAPTVNSRGEVIQGNNRSVALKLMYGSYPESAEKYKQYLKAHASEFGLTAEDIDKMQNPVLVNMLDVTDEDAIKLGQYVAQDTESGGMERIKPRNLAQKMGGDIKTFASLLLNSADSEASFSSLIDANGVDVMKWLSRKGYITETQYSSAFDSKGNLKAEAKNDLQEVLFQSIFQGGSTQLREMFEAMPAKAQRAILATAYRDNDSPNEERMLEEIQSSIRAYYALSLDADFAKAGNYADARRAAELWKRQYQFDDATGESYLPSDKFSNFALELAVLYKGETQKNIQARFNKMYDLIQGAQSNDLFGEADNTKRTLAQAIKEVLNIDYNEKNGSGVLDNGTTRREEGRQGSDGTAAAGERSEDGAESADSGRGTEGVSEQAVEEQKTENASSNAEQPKEKSEKSNKAKQEEAKKRVSLPTHKDWTTYKRKDGTWVNVVGNPKDGYVVRYYGNDESAAKNKEQWSIGEASMPAEDLAMRMGEWTLDEPRLQRTEGGQKVTSEKSNKAKKGGSKGASAKEKASKETVSPLSEENVRDSAVPDDADANVRQKLETHKAAYKNAPNRARGFISNISGDLGLEQHDASHYGTFTAKNGKTFTFRISNHNTDARTFDENGESEGISIVISQGRNKGIRGKEEAKAHVKEFFYSKKEIENAEGKPLVLIIESIEEMLDTGEYVDKTGLAKPDDTNTLKRTKENSKGVKEKSKKKGIAFNIDDPKTWEGKTFVTRKGARVKVTRVDFRPGHPKGFVTYFPPNWHIPFGLPAEEIRDMFKVGVIKGVEDTRLQRTDGGQKVTSEQAKAVTERLKAMMPDTKVTTFKTQKEAEEYIAKQSGKADFFGGEEETFAGATLPNGEVVLVEENMETDTSFHEFAHKLYNYAKTHPEAKALLKAIEKYIAEAPESIKSFVRERYGNLSEDAFMDEVFAWALSTQSKGKLSDFMRARGIEGVLDIAEAQSWYAQIWNTIKEIWNAIRGKFDGGKYADLSVFDAYNEMSAQEIGERLYDTMMGGKQLREVEMPTDLHEHKAKATATSESAVSERERTLRDIVIDLLRRIGIIVIADESVQAVLDEVNAEARLQAKRISGRKQWINAYVTAMGALTTTDKKEIRAEIEKKLADAKREAKELYAKILSGNFDAATLQQINDYIDKATNENRYYRPLSQRLRKRALLPLQRGGRTGEVDALFSRVCESTVPKVERVSAEGRRRIEAKKEELLEKWAKATNNWHESVADFTDKTEPIDSGTDSNVYLSNDGKTVIKASKGKFDSKKYPSDIDQVALFNSVFPHSAYRILGYGRLNGKFVKFLEQDLVDFSTATPLTEEERVEYMRKLGFEPRNEENTVFSNGELIVSDLQKSNIVRDAEGNVRVIDADVKLHTRDIGGKYEYPPVEEDTEVPEKVNLHKVYHGSGADFDAFDHSHMGEGEGAQAYGYGVYVASDKGYAFGYTSLGLVKSSEELSKAARTEDEKWLYGYLDRSTSMFGRKGMEAIQHGIRMAQRKLSDLRWEEENMGKDHQSEIAKKERELKILQSAENGEIEMPHSYLYMVKIPKDTGSNYLNWVGKIPEGLKEKVKSDIDKILSSIKQLPTYEEGKAKYIKDKGISEADFEDHYKSMMLQGIDKAGNVGELYRAVGIPKVASELLSSYGYTGIKALHPVQRDSGRRSAKDYEYVIFNESDAKITDKVRFFRTAEGEAYGFTVGGKIYIDPRIATAETPIHEYAHLWAAALRHSNPKEWQNVVKLMKESSAWEKIKGIYSHLKTDEEIADEVLAYYSGGLGARRLREEQKKIIADNNLSLADKSAAIVALYNVQVALKAFWKGVCDMLHIHFTTAEDIADRVLLDMLEGVDPRQFVPETAEGVVEYSLVRKSEVDAKSQRYFDGHDTNVSQETYEKAQRDMDEIESMMKPLYNATAKGNRILPLEMYKDGNAKSTLFANGSYGKTMENTLKCIRTLAYNQFCDDVKNALGRPLTQRESFLASQMVYDIATDPQCLYCYVSLDRKAYDEFLVRYIEQRDAQLEKFRALPDSERNIGKASPHTALAEMYKDFLDGRKDTKPMQIRFDNWIRNEIDGNKVITKADLTTKEVRGRLRNGIDKSLSSQMKDAEKYAQSASWAKEDVDYISYTGEVLRLSPKWAKFLMEEYGLRFYSFSEYTPAFILENMQMVRDAALRGLNGLAYTKEIDFVKIFAPTGMNINASCYGRRDADGNMVADTNQGADWNEVKQLRKKYPNVASVFVATNDTDVEWALEQDWVDIIIPFHIVRTGADIADFYGWSNYSREQADRKTDSSRTMYISPVEHHNDKDTFLKACAEHGVEPRFKKWINHPNYMRLVNETRLSVDDVRPLQPVFDMDSAKDSWNRFVNRGGYYNGWWRVNDAEYSQAVAQVVNDVEAGKEANNVDYGRQDFPIDPVRMINLARKKKQHGNIPLVDVYDKKGNVILKAVSENADDTHAGNEPQNGDDLFRDVFGGNRGYVGYSKSKRAVRAESEGMRSVSNFDADFVDGVNEILRSVGADEISIAKAKRIAKDTKADEWHHTSMYGNKTNYYSPETIAYAAMSEEQKEAYDEREYTEMAEQQRQKRYEAEARQKEDKARREAVKDVAAEHSELIPTQDGGYWLNLDGVHIKLDGDLTDENRRYDDGVDKETTKRAADAYLSKLKTEVGQKAQEKVRGNRIESTVQDMAEKLHLDNVEFVTDTSTLDEKHKNAKGWYNRRTGKIVIVLPNNESVSDLVQTLLHEAVAHYGLRKLFGAEFDTFLDSVYKNASKEVREAIDELAKKYNGNLHTATEEYLASLAEDTHFDQATKTSWWQQIKDAFFNLLRSIGIKALDTTELTDNELRYILWASYKNLESQKSPILAEAEDIAKQKELGVGKFAEDEEDLFRQSNKKVPFKEWVKETARHLREAWQDAMISVREFQKAVLADRGETMRDSENVYEAENRSHGIITNESEFFDRNFYKPLLEEFNAVAKRAGVKSKDLIYYMIAKHGLERNRIFAQRDGKQQGEKDYSGLTSLTGEANVLDAEAAAQRIVDEMENKVDTTELWNKVNEATKWTLKKAHDCGTISRENYDQIKDMFKYYIPLRGWEEDTAGDIFDYVAGSNNNVFSPTVKKAKGRGSIAENPLAYIAQMAVGNIVQGNKNKVKQTFLNFVQNHPTSLVTVSEMWYRNYGTDTNPDWREDVPYIPENATADEIADIIKNHEDDMKLLEASGKAKKERGKLQLNVPIKKGQALEHHVEVLVNGKKYVLYVNGDPRLAQAINGTRARKANSESIESSKIAEINRWLARAYTSLSPSFTISNLLRDFTMATALTIIKEGGKYATLFQGEMLRLGGPMRMFSLMRKYKEGNLDKNKDVERYFQEFMTNGAETGFTSLKDIERYKAEMEKEFGRMNQKEYDPRRAFRAFASGLENINRCIEDTVRFATYMTSREMGRSVAQSVADAKNITLNFNRKGSGEMGASTFRHLYIFVNPAIQALQTVASAMKHHPVRFSLMAVFIGGMGMVQPLLVELFAAAYGGDDDDWNPVEEYWNLPTWQRRNNYVIWIPFTHKFIMIPLGQEFRMIHGFGENLMSVIRGHADENPALELAEQMTNLLPLDFTGNGGNPFISLAPTLLQTPAQIAFNTRFTGVPLFKDSEWNKYEPSFQKAYAGTPSELVSLSETLNRWTGGNEHKRGWIESNKFGQYANNPAVLNHILQGYLGGAYTFVSGLMGMVWNAMHLEGTDVREIPIVNRVVTEPLETSKDGSSALPEWYYDEVVPGYDEYMNEFNQFMKEAKGGDAAALEHVKEMASSPEFVKWKKIGKLKDAVSTMRSAQRTMQDKQKREQLSAGIDTIMVAIQKVMQEEEQ